jgi:hypothetical protein
MRRPWPNGGCSAKKQIKGKYYIEILRNTLGARKIRKAKWIGHILRRNCLLQRVIEGKIKGRMKATGR